MRLGFVIYGNLDIVTGGFLFDKLVVDYLRRQGDEVEIISLPWHPYAFGLLHNAWAGLARRLRQRRFDAVIQDELTHPSWFWLNRRIKSHIRYPIISLVHLLRSTEERPAWQNRLYRLVERQYLQSVDGFIFISRHTQHLVESLVGSSKRCTIAYSAGDRLGSLTVEQITARILSPGPRQGTVPWGCHPQERVRCAPASTSPAKKPRLAVNHCRQPDHKPGVYPRNL